MRSITITEKEEGQRLDKFLSKYLEKAPKSFLYKMLRKKNIKLNDKKAEGSEKLKKGDEVKLFLAEETIENFKDKKIIENVDRKLDIIFENTHILIINKPADMLSQKAKKEDVSLLEYITNYLFTSGQLTEEELQTFHPGVCNRLDRNTSGIIIAGKTLLGLQTMSALLKERNIGKYYRCIVKGKVTKKQTIEGYLTKDRSHNRVRISKQPEEGADFIRTEYEPVSYTEQFTLLQVKLLTGKSHQIRAHLQSIGHPIIGDGKYGDVPTNKQMRKLYHLKHHLLHSYQLVLPELSEEFSDISNQTITASLPDYFSHIIGELGLKER